LSSLKEAFEMEEWDEETEDYNEDQETEEEI